MQIVVKFALIHELRMFGVDRLKLHSHFEIGLDVYSLKDLPEGTLIYLSYYFIVFSNFFRHLRHG
jgi:hypothetical protein